MTEVNETQAYINYMMRKLPDVQKGETRKIKKGDCLWNIAKQELNNPKATNQQISEYMLLIAKLNNMQTMDKMNNLKIDDEIYLPALQGKAASSEKPVAPETKPKTDAEQAFLKIKDDLNAKNITEVTQASPRFLKMYHVYQHYENKESGYVTDLHPLISFNVDKNGKFVKGSFEGAQNINNYGYDYNIDANGVITENMKYRSPIKGKISPEDMKNVMKQLEELTQGATLAY